MLSRVLSGVEAERAQPLVFATAGLANRLTDVSVHQEGGARDEKRNLQAKIQELQAESATARRQAFESGLQQGAEKARAEIAPMLERMSASLADLTGLRQQLRRSAEQDVVRLSLLIAKRVLHRELNVDPNALTALARVVFERLSRAESYRITVHPQFAEGLRAAFSGHLSSRVEIDADAASPPGTFLIRSEEGSIDASVDTQLEEIGRGLTDRIAGF